jgi:hypothetical protein
MKKLMVLLVFLGVGIGSWAQDTASIVGTVKDSTGAVIAGAKVTVSNPQKGFTRALVSNAVGEYSAPKIPIGDYVITAEVPGFQKLVRTGLTLGVGEMLRVDLTMMLGQVSQEVTVTAAGAKVETETAAISGVVTGAQIANLNLNGRNFVTLALLVPGAVADDGLDTEHVGVYGNNNISFNGGRMQYNNWEIDGGNNTDEGSSSTFNTYPNLDTIAEFRISLSNYEADMGKHAGATIEVATKSGTKDFHGDAFEFVRNDVWDANPWSINRASIGSVAPKSPLKWNDWGYTLGGPIYIPHHYNTSKSKTFFFWSEDWRRYREGIPVSSGVPSLLERQGNFSECDPASTNYNAVVASNCSLPSNPVTGNPYPGDTVPIDPVASTLMNDLIPLPNSGPIGYTAASWSATNWRQEQIRIDENVSDKTLVFMRWTQDAWNTLAVPALWTGSSSDTIKTPFLGPGKSAVIHITHTFSPKLMNEFVASYSVDHISLYAQTGSSSPDHSIDKPSDWTVGHLFSANATNPLLPSVYIGGGLAWGFGADAGNVPWFNSNPIVDLKDNVAWMRGNHAVKFGIYSQDYHKNEQFGGETQGTFYFGNSPITTGNGLADMFLGQIASYSEGTINLNGAAVGGYPKGHWNGHEIEPYIEDDWKVTNKLTLNLGLRYHYFQPFHDVSATNVDAAFIPSEYNPALAAQLVNNPNIGPVLQPGTGSNYTVYGNGLYACGTHGVPKGCYFGYEKNFAPRFGFAYDPFGTGKTSIRGGYGIYYEMGNGNETNAEGGEGNPPVSVTPTAYNLVGYSSIQPINSPSEEPIGPGYFTSIPLHQKWPSVQQFSFDLQHEFPGNNILSVGYVGSLGRHLATADNPNQVPLGAGTATIPSLAGSVGCNAQGTCDIEDALIGPGGPPSVFFQPYRIFTGITGKQNTAVSNYNSLQISLRHDVGKGLSIQAAYTWAHSIDNSTSTYFSTYVDDYNDLSRWKSTSDLNRAQVVEMSYIYELPFFKHASRALVRQGLGGWTFSGISSFYTGEPTSFGCGLEDPVSKLDYATGIGTGVMCNSLGPVKIKKWVYDDPTYGPTPAWINPAVVGQITFPQLRSDGEPGMFGWMGRNALTQPGVNDWDLALLKNFGTPWFKGEHSQLQFRWETFNTFNHTQFIGVSIGCGALTPPGAPCTGENNIGNGEVSGSRSPRVMQLGMKLIF